MDDVRGNGQSLVTGPPENANLVPLLGLHAEADLTPECAHFWLIDTPNGPTSSGTCKICGKEQQFPNSVSSSTWHKGKTKRTSFPPRQ